jgi:hypothetical protein
MYPIDLRFIPVHVPGRDNADQAATNREGRKEKPPRSRLPERVIALFDLAVPHIASYHERLLEKDLFRLLGGYRMPLPNLLGVGFVPNKSGTPIQRIPTGHIISI